MLPRVMGMFAPLLGKVPAGHLWYLARRLRNEKPHRFGRSLRVNTFYPPYPSPAYDRFIDNIASRRRAPYSAYISAAAACPWNCPHCSHGGREGTPLSDDAILSAIADLKQIGACTVGFTGGEPLLRGSLETLIEACGPELSTIVFTSGAGLDDARARSLAAAGVACVTIGVESSDPSEHDRVRGVDGSFVQCMSAAKACADAGVYVALSTIATREKLATGELERIYSLARELNAGELRVLSPVPTGSAAGCDQFCLTAAERKAVAEFHCRHNREPDGPAVAAFAYLESPEMFGCGAGYHHLYVDAYGNVCPCDLTPLSFGNLAERRLADIYADMAEHFSRPRRECIMRNVKMPTGPLPLSPADSVSLCPKATRFDALPDGYRRLGI